jgi:hypothetical protein
MLTLQLSLPTKIVLLAPSCPTAWPNVLQGYKPKTPGRLGLKKNDKGEFPIEHPEIVKHSDVGHYLEAR